MIAASGDFTIQLSATGTKPLAWSLKSSSSIFNTLPAEASIDNNGLLTIGGNIKVGNYTFVVQVSNSAGSDEKVVSLR